MNPRVLELIKNPKNIQLEDLGLLKEEIHAFPYIQNIRALHLYGVHLYEKENYQKELSTTAAYTTDKKILYQLINGKIRQEKPVVEANSSKTLEKAAQLAYKNKAFPIQREVDSAEKNAEEEACVLPTSQEIKHIYINGERNRILFEGEENFLNEDNSETIDLESTLESGTLVTQKAELVANSAQNEQENEQTEIQENAGENFSSETVINEDKISSESEEAKVEEEDHVSFEETEPILPEVSVEENTAEEKIEAEPVLSTEEEQTETEENAGENFSAETVINEDKISSESEEVKVEDEDDVSFQEIEPISEEVNIEETASEPIDVEKTTENKVDSVEETEAPEVESDAEVSFHGTEAFLPDVKIKTNNEEITEAAEITSPNVNKHEEEMRRLIEEVEKKMKETKAVPQQEKEETEQVPDHEISFAETQNFHFWSTSEDSPASEEAKDQQVQEENIEVEGQLAIENSEEEIAEPETPEVESAWKPMSVEAHVPDSLLNKSPEITPVAKVSEEEIPAITEEVNTDPKKAENEPETAPEEELSVVEEITEEEELPQNTEDITEHTDVPVVKDEEVPVMNVSFFGTDISSLSVEQRQQADQEKESSEEKPVQESVMKNEAPSVADSNVPGFINTWQSWLKIGRTEEVEKEKEVIKEKAIETFIENNPKISQLKEESSYVVKEKNDDISHLMTETLANLYFEQKLYTKAIKAFEILIKKNPKKKEYFESKIQDIRDFRSKN